MKKVRIRNSTECTGLRAEMTMKADADRDEGEEVEEDRLQSVEHGFPRFILFAVTARNALSVDVVLAARLRSTKPRVP